MTFAHSDYFPLLFSGLDVDLSMLHISHKHTALILLECSMAKSIVLQNLHFCLSSLWDYGTKHTARSTEEGSSPYELSFSVPCSGIPFSVSWLGKAGCIGDTQQGWEQGLQSMDKIRSSLKGQPCPLQGPQPSAPPKQLCSEPAPCIPGPWNRGGP